MVSSISSKKRTKTHCIVVQTNSFVCFLEEFTAWQFAFEINWPLAIAFFQISQIFWLIVPFCRMLLWGIYSFRLFLAAFSIHVLSLCFPTSWFFINKPFFSTRNYAFHTFLRKIYIFGLWFWPWRIWNIGLMYSQSVRLIEVTTQQSHWNGTFIYWKL